MEEGSYSISRENWPMKATWRMICSMGLGLFSMNSLSSLVSLLIIVSFRISMNSGSVTKVNLLPFRTIQA